MKSMKKHSRYTRHSLAIILGATLLVVAGGLVAYHQLHKHIAPLALNPSPLAAQKNNAINYGPPTAEEKAQADANKQRLAQQTEQNNTQSSSPSTKTVTPTITSVVQNGSQIQVYGYVSGIVEDNGSCAATFTQAGQTVTKISQAFANATTTNCTTLSLDRSEFPTTGEWQVTLTYSSQTAKGISQPRSLNIQ